MLLLEYANKIIEDTLVEKWTNKPEEGKYESLEATIADFDGVTFHLATDATQKNLLNISVSIKCWRNLEPLGVKDLLQSKYGPYVVAAESGYDYTLQVDLAKPPADIPKTAHEIALFKRHALGPVCPGVFGYRGKEARWPVD